MHNKAIAVLSCTFCILLMLDSFLRRVEIMIKKEKVIEVVVDEGWYTIAEMKNELKWSEPCP